jgi:DNA helicase II / ATP-dependent DNA helicase PcrA
MVCHKCGFEHSQSDKCSRCGSTAHTSLNTAHETAGYYDNPFRSERIESTPTHDFFSSLNSCQRRVVQTVDGPLLVVAGAGTGKTRTLIYRCAYLAASAGIQAGQLLAITFTAKAADEMRQRSRSFRTSGIDLTPMWIGTIHALCCKILQTDGDKIGIKKDFEIVPSADRTAIIKNLIKKYSAKNAAGSFRKFELQISREKNAVGSYEKMSPFCKAYQERLEDKGMLDFDDLILKTLVLFKNSPNTAKKLGSQFTHISVDEYQDINGAQYHFIQNLCAAHQNLCAVGDADQAIYAFRGAQINNFLDFQKDFPQAPILYLQENYRSTGTILKAAHHVIEKNRQRIKKILIPTRPPGAYIEIAEMDNEQEEASFVAREIIQLLGGTTFETVSSDGEACVGGFGDIAILYRLHQQSRILKDALQKQGIPVEVAVTRSLYEEPEIRPVINLLELIVNPHNDLAYTEMLFRSPWSLGSKTIEMIASDAASRSLSMFTCAQQLLHFKGIPRDKHKRISDFVIVLAGLTAKSSSMTIDKLIEEIWSTLHSGNSEQQDVLLALLTSSMAFAHVPATEGIRLLLNKISLLQDNEPCTFQKEAVMLMTAHSSKGLEFPVVFITGLEEGLFPYLPDDSESKEDDIEEERRLFYVGMTRAKDKLYLLHAKNRFLFGERKTMAPSSFLKDLPEDTIIKQAKNIFSRKKEKSKQMKLFTI